MSVAGSDCMTLGCLAVLVAFLVALSVSVSILVVGVV